jgi:hypothetical protein
MADGIFTEDELKAEQTGIADGATVEEQEQAEKDRQEPARGPDGKFLPKEEVVTEPVIEEAEKEKGGTVPIGALHAEREGHKTTKAELAKAKEILDALAKMKEQVGSRKPEALPEADDPAAVEHLRTRLAELEQGQTRITQHMDTEAINNAELQQLGSVMHQSETAYRAEKPDYDEAIDHVVQARARELSLYGLTPPQIQQTISEEATEIVRSAVAQGRDPAELGYQIALSRGYQPKAVEQAGNGADKSAAQVTLDAIATAKASGKSLGSASGSTPKQLNAEAVLKMTPEEFDAVYSTPEGKAMIDSL